MNAIFLKGCSFIVNETYVVFHLNLNFAHFSD